MSKILINKMIEAFNNTPWCIDRTRGSGPLGLGLIPNGVVFELKGSKRKMEQETENSESDPLKPQDGRVDFMQRGTGDGFKNRGHRYCAISTERGRAFCRRGCTSYGDDS